MLFAACNTFSLLLLFCQFDYCVCVGIDPPWVYLAYTDSLSSYTWVTVSHIMENFQLLPLQIFFLVLSLSLSFL